MASSKPKINDKQEDLVSAKIPKHLIKPLKWTFSFEYFNQIEFFSLKKTDPHWFTSLLQRLKIYSTYDDNNVKTHTQRDDLRYHEINWKATNIPIAKSDLNWIPSEILNNDIEYPFFQFGIAKGLGRIVGFWKQNVFCITLLDPMHNMQPSKDYNYFVTPCSPVSSNYDSLMYYIDQIKTKKCSNNNCPIHDDLHKIPTHYNNESNMIIAHLDNDSYEKFVHVTTTTKTTFTNLLETGILFHIDEKK